MPECFSNYLCQTDVAYWGKTICCVKCKTFSAEITFAPVLDNSGSGLDRFKWRAYKNVCRFLRYTWRNIELSVLVTCNNVAEIIQTWKSIVTRWKTWTRFPTESRNYFASHVSQPPLWNTQPPVEWYRSPFPLGTDTDSPPALNSIMRTRNQST